MNTPLRNLQKEALLLKLSSTEKAALHANLMRAVRLSANTDASAPRATASPYFFFFSPQFAVPLAALLVVLLGGGTAFAAQGSLPGDPLYAVKVKVSEPIQGALAVSTEAKIKFHTQVAQTRLEEAEVLASQNRLDASTTAELESNLDTHLAARDELTATLDESGAGASDEAASELNSSIAAHGEVLAALGVESSSSTTRQNSDTLASKVRSNRGATVALAMAKTAVPMMAPQAGTPAVHPTVMAVSLAVSNNDEASSSASSSASASVIVHTENARVAAVIATSSNTRAQKNAVSLEARATSSLETLRHTADAARAHLSADVALKLDARISNIASLLADGEASLTGRDFDAASQSFSEALNRSVTLSTFLSANARFDSGILGNLLKHDNGAGDSSEEDN